MAILTAILETFHISWTNILLVVLCVSILPVYHVVRACYGWLDDVITRSKAFERMPGPEQHWLWGNLMQIPVYDGYDAIFSWSQDLTRRFPKYNKMGIGRWRQEVILRHPDAIKKILTTSEPKPTSLGGRYDLLIPWLGDGLLVSSGPKWFRNRKLLTPGFHFDVLKPYMAIYNQAAETLIGKWKKESARTDSIEIYKSVSLCTLDVMLRCAFTYESDVQLSENKYVKTVSAMAELLIERGLSPWFYLDFIYYLTPKGRQFKEGCRYAHEIAYKLINTRQKLLSENPDSVKDRKYVDFLDILLLAKDERGEGLTLEEIRQEVDTFLFEGHDTTASAISWFIYNMAKHPKIQQKCREEVTVLFDKRPDPTVEWDDLQKMPYLTQCIKESLRMYPPVPFVIRELSKPLDIDGHILPPKTSINIITFSVHHHPGVWGEDHNEFKPERFHPDKIKDMDPYAFIPFSAGPRNCIGQNFAMHEIKTVAARLLHQFEFAPDDSEKPDLYPMIVFRAKDGIKLFVKTVE